MSTGQVLQRTSITSYRLRQRLRRSWISALAKEGLIEQHPGKAALTLVLDRLVVLAPPSWDGGKTD